MKCANCGAENLEDMRFCGECGNATAPQIQRLETSLPKRNWTKSHWKPLAAICVAAIVILTVGLVFTQPTSRIAVFLDNRHSHSLDVGIYVDGKLVSARTIEHDATTDFLEVFPVKTGTHTVGVEVAGSIGLTGSVSYLSTIEIGLFANKEVWVPLID